MKNNTNKVLCKCKEWRDPSEMCMDNTCIYCENTETNEDDEPTELLIGDLEPSEFELEWDLENLSDAYIEYEDDDEL